VPALYSAKECDKKSVIVLYKTEEEGCDEERNGVYGLGGELFNQSKQKKATPL